MPGLNGMARVGVEKAVVWASPLVVAVVHRGTAKENACC